MTDPLDLAAIEERLAKATPGPWYARTEGGVDQSGEGWSQSEVDFGDDPLGPGAHLGEAENAPADADLIAHAPADLAALIAEVNRLRAEAAGHVETIERQAAVIEGVEDVTELVDRLVASHDAASRDASQPDVVRAAFSAGGMTLLDVADALRAALAVAPEPTEGGA